MLDAIGRALVRMLVTRRRLLEWVTADRADERRSDRVDGRAADVAGAGRRAWRSRSSSRSSRPGGCCSRGPILVLWCSRRRSPTSPGCRCAHRETPLDRDRARARSGAVARRTWRFFEELVGPAGPLADPRQLSGEPPGRHRAPHVADQHRAAAALDAGGVRLRLPQLRRRRSTGSSRPSTRCCGCSATAATSTTGTTRARSRRWRPPTSRPSTAATSPAIC